MGLEIKMKIDWKEEERQKKLDEKYFKQIKEWCCEMIVFAFHKNHNDTDFAIEMINKLQKRRVKQAQKTTTSKKKSGLN